MDREERLPRVLAMTREGVSAKQIALELGVSARTIHRDRAVLGVAQQAPERLTRELHELAHRLLEDGCSYREVARTVGRSDVQIRRAFPGYGWTGQQSGSWTRELGLMKHIYERKVA